MCPNFMYLIYLSPTTHKADLELCQKSQVYTQTLTPPEKNIQSFENGKMNETSPMPCQCTTFHQKIALWSLPLFEKPCK